MPTLSASPSTVTKGVPTVLTLTGTGTAWTLQSPAGLFSATALGGSSLGTPTIASDTAATVTLTAGPAAPTTLTLSDNSTGATTSIVVVPPRDPFMSIQYAGGTIVSATLTQSAGTRAELAQWIRDQLVLAGWTSSGSATDYQLTSATTPQSLACRVRCYDSGAGNCARLKFSNTAATKTQAGDLFLLPAAAKVWRLIANKYQFFVMTPGSSVAREFACGGVPYLPSFLSGVVTEAIWCQGNANGDADTTTRVTFRSRLDTGTSTNTPNAYSCVNGSSYELNATAGGVANQKFAPPWSAFATSQQSAYRWHDDSVVIVEPLIAWGATTTTDEAKLRGQLWDAAILTDAYAADTTVTLDARTYWAITGSNAGASGANAPGTLLVAVT